MKKIITAAVVLCLAAFSAQAQTERKTKHGRHQHKQELKQQLNLSQAQQQQAEALRKSHKTAMQELNRNENITVKEYRDRKEALRKQHKAAMQALLTGEQKAKLAEMKASKKAAKEEAYARKMDRMKASLQLTDEQVSRLKADRAAMQERLKGIRENENLGRQQRKEQLMALKNERKARLESVLTAEQRQKMKEMKQKRPSRNAVK